MASVVIAGDTSGTVTLAAPAVAGTTTLTLPATSGTVGLVSGNLGTPTTLVGTNITGTANSLNAGLGVNQTWQDMTASRSGGVTYTNSTGKPISIVATCGLNGSTMSLTIGGSIIQSMGNTGAGNGNVTGIVPNNTTYSVYLPSALSAWYELR